MPVKLHVESVVPFQRGPTCFSLGYCPPGGSGGIATDLNDLTGIAFFTRLLKSSQTPATDDWDKLNITGMVNMSAGAFSEPQTANIKH